MERRLPDRLRGRGRRTTTGSARGDAPVTPSGSSPLQVACGIFHLSGRRHVRQRGLTFGRRSTHSEAMDEFEPHIIKLPELTGAAEWRAEIERHRAEARRRYLAHLAAVLAELSPATAVETLAAAELDKLVVWTDVASGERCSCSCHPGLPDSDLHDYGFDCTCQQPLEERRARASAWLASIDEFWESDEGRELAAARQADEDELAAWLSERPDLVVHRHGGLCPEQWRGEVDGHSFYFRERHDHWRVELDLRPSGRY